MTEHTNVEDIALHRANKRIRMLEEAGIKFVIRDNDGYISIMHNGEVIDFWPKSGRFYRHDTGARGHSYDHLCRILEICEEGSDD